MLVSDFSWHSLFLENLPQKSICGWNVFSRHNVIVWSGILWPIGAKQWKQKRFVQCQNAKSCQSLSAVTPAGLVQHQQADVILKCTLYCLNSLAGRWLMTKSKCVSLTKQSSSWVEELYVGSKPLLKSTFSYWSLHLRRENQFYFLMPHNCPLESRPLWSKFCTAWPTCVLRLSKHLKGRSWECFR